MPSSTSSSSAAERVPALPWLRLGVAVAVLAFALVAAAEALWRAQGFTPTSQDGAALWSLTRDQATGDALVILGSSRIQTGFDMAYARQRGYRPVMLAIDATSPRRILEDLAHDPSFRGVVLCGVWAETLVPGPLDLRAEGWLAQHRRASLDTRLNQRARAAFQRTFVLASYNTSIHRVLRHLFDAGRLPEPSYLTTDPDRGRANDFARAPDLVGLRESGLRARQRVPFEWTENRFEAQIAEWQGWVDQIEARGGHVAFARLPSSGTMAALEAERAPRAGYWDTFAATIDAPTWHFEDADRNFVLPDESHVDITDRVALTELMLDFLAAHGLTPATP